MTAPCPRCSSPEAPVPMLAGAGALGEAVCPRCGGRLLDEAAVQRVIIEEHGIAPELLREMAGHFGRPTLHCPGCRQRMHPIRLRALALDLCTGCGAVWLDAGELASLSEGRWPEVPAPGDAPPEVAAPPPPSPAPQAPPAAHAVLTVVLEDDRADAERLAAAFGRARFRTAHDARFAAQHGHGIVAERVSTDEAQALAAALELVGLGCRLLEPAALELPRAVRTREASCTDQGIAVADGLGRPLTLPWPNLRALEVGQVRLEEAEIEIDPSQPSEHVRNESGLPLPRARRTVMVERKDWLLDLVGVDEHGDRWRYRTTRDSLIVRHRRPGDQEAAFAALVKGVLAFAPATTVLARGAATATQPDAPWAQYRALRDFEQALRWALARATDTGRSTP